jgi:hypothetical protein
MTVSVTSSSSPVNAILVIARANPLACSIVHHIDKDRPGQLECLFQGGTASFGRRVNSRRCASQQ